MVGARGWWGLGTRGWWGSMDSGGLGVVGVKGW